MKTIVLFTFGLVNIGHGAQSRPSQDQVKAKSRPSKSQSRPRSRSPTILSKTPLSEIQPKNPVTLQQNELQSIIDTLNQALMKNKEIQTVFSRTITPHIFHQTVTF